MPFPSKVLLLLPQVFVHDSVPIHFLGTEHSQDKPKDENMEQPLLEA